MDRVSFFGWEEIGYYKDIEQDDLEYIQKLFKFIPKAIDFTLKYCKDANWEAIHRAMDILNAKYKGSNQNGDTSPSSTSN